MAEVVRYGANAPRVAPWAEERLKKYMRAAGINSVLVSSSRRTAADQARIMYNLAQQHGVDYAKRLYGSAGDTVLSAYVKDGGSGCIFVMAGVINSVGPTNVSNHCAITKEVLDVAPSSIPSELHDTFASALEQARRLGEISELELPPGDPAFHITFVTGAPDNEIVVIPRTSGVKVIGSVLFILGVGWLFTRS